MITIPVHPYGIRLHFTTVPKAMKKAYKEYSDEELDTDVAGQAWHVGLDYYIGVYDKGPECLDTLAHEITHTVIDIAMYIGYDPSSQQEPFAYLVGWMTKTLLLAHPKFKEAMNEPVGIRAGNGGRRAAAGNGPHQQQRGSGESAQQPVCPGSVSPVCGSAE